MNFTTTINAESSLFKLTFSPVYTFDSYKLFVRAVNLQGEVVNFEMKKDSFNQWGIALPAPEWAIKYKKDLVAILVQNL